jgi:hypothetical protein
LNFHLPRRLRVKAAVERLAAAKAAREAMDEPVVVELLVSESCGRRGLAHVAERQS